MTVHVPLAQRIVGLRSTCSHEAARLSVNGEDEGVSWAEDARILELRNRLNLWAALNRTWCIPLGTRYDPPMPMDMECVDTIPNSSHAHNTESHPGTRAGYHRGRVTQKCTAVDHHHSGYPFAEAVVELKIEGFRRRRVVVKQAKSYDR